MLLALAAGVPSGAHASTQNVTHVAVLDTGISPHATFLAQHPLADWVDLTGEDAASPVDPVGHGTAVASIVEGLDPSMELSVARVLDRNATGDYAWIEAGLDWATMKGAQVTLVAISGLLPDAGAQPGLDAALRRADAAGNVVVWAAGNGIDGEPLPPSDLQTGSSSWDVIVAGSATARGDPSTWSGLDPTLITRGEDVMAENLEGQPSPVTGTSYAAARVAGLLAEASHGRTLSVGAVKEALAKVARDRLQYPDEQEGDGLLEDADEPALDQALAAGDAAPLGFEVAHPHEAVRAASTDAMLAVQRAEAVVS